MNIQQIFFLIRNTQKVNVNYELLKEVSFNWKIPFFISLFLTVFLAGYIIFWPKPISLRPNAEKFIEGMKRTKRILIRQVVYAILVLAYEKQDKLIDQSKIRGILKKEGFSDINSHKSEIHGIINSGEIDFLIIKNESKIEINPQAEKEYQLGENAKTIITKMKKMIIKEESYDN